MGSHVAKNKLKKYEKSILKPYYCNDNTKSRTGARRLNPAQGSKLATDVEYEMETRMWISYQISRTEADATILLYVYQLTMFEEVACHIIMLWWVRNFFST